MMLKPCPFCGNKQQDLFKKVVFVLAVKETHIECMVCGAMSPVKLKKDNLNKLWNNRARAK